MVQIKLELQQRTDIEVVEFTKSVGTKLTANVNFSSPPVTGAALTTDANALEALLLTRASLETQLLQNTLQIRTAREKCEAGLGLDGAYVEQIINTIVPPATVVDPAVAGAKALSAGMEIVGARAPVGPMPKVEGLRATQGDGNGEVDLHWNPVKRGLSNYLVEMTDDPTGVTGWHIISTPTKSSMTVTGLTSGKRYWFRVTANGAAGQGPASEAATKVAP